jgi:hypothetical protein
MNKDNSCIICEHYSDTCQCDILEQVFKLICTADTRFMCCERSPFKHELGILIAKYCHGFDPNKTKE